MVSTSFSRFILLAVSALLIVALAASVQARPSNAWRLHFDGKADKDGVVVLKIIPKDHEDGDLVKIDIDEGDRENVAARKVARALRKDARGYDIDYEDGEEVQIRTRVGTDNFEIQVQESIPGLSIKIDRN